jgi:hypothetical protein
MKKTVSEFLKEQGCLFITYIEMDKIYFCEYTPITVHWYGKPVEVGIKFKDTCIVTEFDRETVIDYSAVSPLAGDALTNDWGVMKWEEALGKKADETIDVEAREDWLKACEEE